MSSERAAGVNRVIIYEEEGADPRADLLDVRTDAGRTRVRAVGAADEVAGLVSELIASGVDRIELCGAFGAVWHARVTAVAGNVPVGAIYYGFESLTSVASYKARFEAGEILSDAFVVRHPGADPHRDRVVRTNAGGGRTYLVAVPDEAAAARTAAELAPDVQLIELYGLSGPAAAAPVIEAVASKVPIGVTAFRS